MTICKSSFTFHSRQIAILGPQQSILTEQMLFLMPSQLAGYQVWMQSTQYRSHCYILSSKKVQMKNYNNVQTVLIVLIHYYVLTL